MKLFRSVLFSLTLLFTICSAYTQQATAFPEQLKGNWFLEENTNEWVFGVYDKLAYYKNDFWPYRLLSVKENEARLLLQKGSVAYNLIVSFQSDTVVQISNRGTVQTLTNSRRPMAAPGQLTSAARSNTVYIKGYTAFEQKMVQFVVRDLLLGKTIWQTTEVDKNGWFSIRLPMPTPGSEVTVQLGNVFETMILAPGDTATLYFDGTNTVVGGKPGPITNEYRDYLLYSKQWDDQKELQTMIRNSNEQQYLAYELAKKKRADSLLQHYQQTYTMSAGLFERLQQNNKYNLANNLLRYRWLHEPDKTITVSPEYAQLVNTFIPADRNAWLGGSYYNGFVHEMMNITVVEHLSDRSRLDSFVLARSSPGSAFDYIQQYDRTMSPAQLKDIDRLLKYAPRFARLNRKLSLSFHATDTIAQKKIVSQFTDLLNWLGNNDYFHYYFANLELLYKLNRIDSLYPKSAFRDDLLGHYLYAHCLDNSRLILDDATLGKLQTMCNDTVLYNLVVAENRQNKQQLDLKHYENLVAPAATPKEETVLNRIARQHKGKVVYVDIWATWCIPCMEQFPYSKALKKELDGKPIDFVYLCCDSDITDWQNMIKKYALPGQHLLLTPEEKARLQGKYNVGSYPRYMVIDKQGKLISSNSFAPQQREIVVPLMEALVK